jgi:hypothetical protein
MTVQVAVVMLMFELVMPVALLMVGCGKRRFEEGGGGMATVIVVQAR